MIRYCIFLLIADIIVEAMEKREREIENSIVFPGRYSSALISTKLEMFKRSKPIKQTRRGELYRQGLNKQPVVWITESKWYEVVVFHPLSGQADKLTSEPANIISPETTNLEHMNLPSVSKCVI